MSDLFQSHAAKSGPVECLGQTFPSDEARREHYLKLLAENLKDQKASFSEIAREEIQQMEDVCIDCFRYAIEALEERSKEKAMKVIEKESQADELEIALRTAHMKRLARNECSTESGIVFLDALVCLERISDHARNIAEEILTAE